MKPHEHIHPDKMTVDYRLTFSDYDCIAYALELCGTRFFGWRINSYADWLFDTSARYLEDTEGLRDLYHIAEFCGQRLYATDKEWTKRIDDIYMVISAVYYLRNKDKK